MNNREYAEVLMCAAGDLVHSRASSDAFRSMIRGGAHRKLSTNDIHKHVIDAEYAAAARIDASIAAIDGETSPMENKDLREEILGYTPDQLADQLLALAKQLLAADAPKAVDTAPTRQEPARAPITKPVRVVVRQDLGRPVWDQIEDAMKKAGIPGRVAGHRITVERGDVEWEVWHDGTVMVRWWPAGR